MDKYDYATIAVMAILVITSAMMIMAGGFAV